MSKEIVIGVVSDTHLEKDSDAFLLLVERFFKDCDFIIHCGDITNENIFLTVKKNIIAVKGNMDLYSKLPEKRVLELLYKKIGIIHGYGHPEGIRKRIRREFEDVDCIVYGHTHYPFYSYEDGILFFNPGSPFDKRWAPKNTVGYLKITEKKIEGKIVDID